MLRNFVCVGFHSSQGDGARAVMRGCYEITFLPPAARCFTGLFLEKTAPCSIWTREASAKTFD